MHASPHHSPQAGHISLKLMLCSNLRCKHLEPLYTNFLTLLHLTQTSAELRAAANVGGSAPYHHLYFAFCRPYLWEAAGRSNETVLGAMLLTKYAST